MKKRTISFGSKNVLFYAIVLSVFNIVVAYNIQAQQSYEFTEPAIPVNANGYATSIPSEIDINSENFVNSDVVLIYARNLYSISASSGDPKYYYQAYFGAGLSFYGQIFLLNLSSPKNKHFFFIRNDFNYNLREQSLGAGCSGNTSGEVVFGPKDLYLDQYIGSMSSMITDNHIGFCNGNFTTTFRFNAGATPLRPDSIKIRDKKDELSIDKATEGDTVKIIITPNALQLIDRFVIEKSIDNKQTWTPLNVKPTRVQEGHEEESDNERNVGGVIYYVMDSFNNITSPPTSGGKRVFFRARTYASSNPLIGKSIGFVQTDILVYPRPTCNNVSDKYYCEISNGLTSVKVEDIQAESGVNKIKVSLEKYNEDLDIYNPVPDFSKQVENQSSPINVTLSNSPNRLDEGDYQIVLENVYEKDGVEYACGHTYKKFKIFKKPSLNEFFYSDISIDCPYGGYGSLVKDESVLNDIIVEKGYFFDSIEFGKTNNSVEDPSNHYFEVLGENKFNARYTSSPTCRVNFSINVDNKYPEITFEEDALEITYGCFETSDSFMIANNSIIIGSDGSEEYELLKYSVNNSDWTTLGGIIEGRFDTDSVLVTVGGFENDSAPTPVCTYEKSFIYNPKDSISIIINTSDVSFCDNASNGVISVSNIINVIYPLNYYLNEDLIGEIYSGGFDINDLSPRVHTVKIIDSIGCEYTSGEILIEGASDPFSFDSILAEDAGPCAYSTNGQVDFLLKGVGSENFLAKIGDDWVQTSSFANLSSGSYTLSAKPFNVDSCIIHSEISIEGPEAFTIQANTIHPTCNDGNTGEIILTNSYSPVDVTYKMSTNLIDWESCSPIISELNAGTYYFTVVNLESCTSDPITVELSAPAKVAIINETIQHALCHDTTGKYTFNISGGTPPYNFYIKHNSVIVDSGIAASTDVTLEKFLAAGNYTIEIFDSMSCINDITEFSISQPEALSFEYSLDTIKCFGETIDLNVLVTGGTPFFDESNQYYKIDFNGSALEGEEINEHNLTAGFYSIRAVDYNSCIIESEISISQPQLLEADFLETANPTCNGFSNGFIKLEINGGINTENSIYRIVYGTNESQMDTLEVFVGNEFYLIDSLSEGAYMIRILDENNCRAPVNSDYLFAELYPPDPMFIKDEVVTSASCFDISDGSISFIVEGRQGINKTIEIFKNGLLEDVIESTDDSFNLNGLEAATYNIVVKDVDDCFVNKEIIIEQPDKLTYSINSSNVICINSPTGSVEVNASGGNLPYNIQLFNEENVLVDSASGNDTFIVFENLPPSQYYIQLTDDSGCIVENPENSVVIVNNPLVELSVDLSSVELHCNGDNTGQIIANALGGWGNYSFSLDNNEWTNSDSNEFVFNNLQAGLYNVFVKDELGCTVDNMIEITQPSLVVLDSIFVKPVSCFNGSDGELMVFVSGGLGGYEYDFGNGFGNQNYIQQLSSGKHNFLVTDINGCGFKDSVEIHQPSDLTAVFQKNSYNLYNIRCFGLSDEIRILANGGTAPYTVFYQNDLSISSIEENSPVLIDGFYAGKHDITFIDDNQCSYTFSTTLTEPQKVEISSIDIGEPTCFGDNNGRIRINEVLGGVTNYDISLFGISGGYNQSINTNSGARFDDILSDNYLLTIIDANLCETDTIFFVSQPEKIVLDNISTQNIICKGDDNGAIYITVAGGDGDYRHIWHDENMNLLPSNRPFIEDQLAGLYFYSVSDSKGCVGLNPITDDTLFNIEIIEPEHSLTLNEVLFEMPRCFNDNNGSIMINSSGGWNNHRYSLNYGGLQLSNEFIALESGDMSLIVKDEYGCSVEEYFFLPQPDSLILYVQSINHVMCNGENTGSVLLNAVGGNGGFEFGTTPENLQKSSLIEGLYAGDYSLIVTDTKGCEAENYVIINQPDSISYVFSEIQEPVCGLGNGLLNINPEGGIAPYTIEWTSHELPSVFEVSELLSGLYEFVITDSEDCSRNFSYSLNDIGGPELSNVTTTEPTCAYRQDGKIEVSFEGNAAPYQIIWKDSQANVIHQGEELLQNIQSGIYSISIIDANGCIFSEFIELAAPLPLSANLFVDNVVCINDNNGSANAVISGGTPDYNMFWMDNSGNVIGNGNSISQLFAGEYYFSVKDINGCGFGNDNDSIATSFMVSQPALPLDVAASNIVAPTCFGGNNARIVLSGTGGWGNYLYSINGTDFSSNNIFNDLYSGDYNVFAKDSKGCIENKTVSINDPEKVIIDNIIKQDVKCFGDANGLVTLAASGGTSPYSYSINNGITWNNHGLFSNLDVGEYQIFYRDVNLCIDSIDVLIEQPPILDALADEIIPANCNNNNGQITINIDGGVAPYIVKWDHIEFNSGLTISKLYSGNYTARIADKNHCNVSISLDVPEIDGPEILSYQTVDPLCYNSADGIINIEYTGYSAPYSFYLNGTQVDSSYISNIPKGFHEFMVVDNFGCEDVINFSLNAPDSLYVEFSDIVSPQCYGYSNGSIFVNPLGGVPPYSFLWNNSITDTNLINIPSGNYHLLLSDGNNCIFETIVVVDDPEKIEINLPETVSICKEQSATLDAGNPNCQHWWTSDSGYESYSQIISVSESGKYFIQVTDNKGCFANDTVMVNKYDYDVNSTLLVPGHASVGETIVVIDISWPIPEELIWQIPDAFTIVNNSLYEKHLIPEEEGNYLIGLTTSTGDCSAFNEKAITISGFYQPELDDPKELEVFDTVKIWPNPARHSTTIDIQLNREADVNVEIFNSLGLSIFNYKQSGFVRYSFNVPLKRLSPGLYLVKISSEESIITLKLLVN